MSVFNRIGLVAVGLSLFAVTAWAAPAEEKWQITSKMEIPGMPFQMPATTATVCVPQGQPSEKMVPAKENCKVSNFKTVGNTSSFHIECPPPEKMSGDGKFTVNADKSSSGQMNIKGVMEGEPMEMKMSWSSKKLGMCDAVKDKAISPTAMMAESQAMTAQSCKEIANGMGWQVAEHMGTTCPTLKTDICKKAKIYFDAPKKSDAALDLQEKRGDWKELAGYCGIKPAAITQKYCGLAKAEQHWNNAAVLCGKDKDLEVIAVRECTGKMYTGGLIDDKYQSLCALYADQVDPGKDPKAKPATKADKAVDTTKKVFEGFKKFKGLMEQ